MSGRLWSGRASRSVAGGSSHVPVQGELVAYQSYCRRLDLEKVTHLVGSNIPEPSKEGKSSLGAEKENCLKTTGSLSPEV